jgi:hypothetical protein
MAEAFTPLRRTVQRNLAVLTLSFARVLGAARSGQGHLSLAALSRVLATSGTPRARAKRLHRFLDNTHLDPRGVTEGLARLIFGRRGEGFWPILFDQTQSGSTQALFAGVPYEGRTLPLAVYTFCYPWQEPATDSQNQFERVFLLDVAAALPEGTRAVFIGDRGYARASLLRQSTYDARLFVIRGRGGTRVEYQGQSVKLCELQGPDGTAVRYTEVLYHDRQRVPVDVIVYRDSTFQESWWLLVPPRSEAVLPTAGVVALYRERMQVEHSFRDFKTHLGLRGLQLQVRIAERTGRLLLAFCIAYCLALVLGASREGQEARVDLEVPRRRPRHGTCRTLSVLSVAMQMMSHPRWRHRAWTALLKMTQRLATGRRLLERGPPQVSHLFSATA